MFLVTFVLWSNQTGNRNSTNRHIAEVTARKKVESAIRIILFLAISGITFSGGISKPIL